MGRWDEDLKTVECFTCGKICKGNKDIVLCDNCRKMYDGFVLMGCANCGNNKMVLLTENLRPKLEWLIANGFAVKKVSQTYFVLYPFCPRCKGGKNG